jgi:predicted DNA-binding protein (MmcQ/YjbR family)
MDRGTLRAYCLAKTAAVEDFPFGEGVAVYKVLGKVFALLPVSSNPLSISLKCDPVLAELLRETYPTVTPGYHLNKRHWNSIEVDGSIPEDELLEMIDHSYDQVVKGMTKTEKAQLNSAASSGDMD